MRGSFDLTLRFNSNNVRAEGKSKSLRIIKQSKIGAGAGKTQVFKALAGDFKVRASPTQLFLNTSPVIANVELINVQSLIKRLLSKLILIKAVDILPVRRIRRLLVYWQKLTLNQDILSVANCYRILFIKVPFLQKISKGQ